MNTDATARAAQAIASAWQEGQAIAHLSEAARPRNRAEGYALQARVIALGQQPLAVWKIAATSSAGQRHINVSGPLAGQIAVDRVHADGASLSMAGNRMAVAEAEFVFRMGQTLAPRAQPYTLDEVMAAVADLYLGIEVPNSRFADFVGAGEAQLIADNACAHVFVLGPRVQADWRAADLAAHRVQAQVDGTARSYAREGIGANVLGDPRLALQWLVNELSQHGMTLEAGCDVTTGTCVVPLAIEVGDHVQADFGAFGRVEARFTA